jgi:hypothetical protein
MHIKVLYSQLSDKVLIIKNYVNSILSLEQIGRRNILIFVSLNTYVFLYGFMNFDSIYPLNEAVLMSFLFFTILSFQVILVYYFKKVGSIISIIFSLGNFFYFNIVLNGQSRNINIAYLFVFMCCYILINRIRKVKIIVFFFVILILTSLTNNFIKNFFVNKIYFSNNIKYQRSKNNSNIFFIGIDGMISTAMYHKYFLSQSPASNMLDSLSFSRYDMFSPGESTLETYAKYFSYNDYLHPRLYLKVINSKSSSFFFETKKMGYKKQFNFYTNYFGGDPNNIFDSYYPNESKPFGFVLYTDIRWGWYIAYLIKKVVNSYEKDNDKRSQIEMICNRIQLIDLKKNKWISISHLWLPGHTIESYDFNDISDFSTYKNYHENSQIILASFFKKITNIILKKDKKAIIIFYGDHGAYLLRKAISNTTINGIKITDELVLHDKKHVQLAVYPSNYLDTKDIKEINLNPQNLFKIIIEKRENFYK